MEIRRTLQALIPVLGRTSAPSQPVPPLQALQAGQRIQARVLAQTGPNQVMLEMLGSRVIADTQVSLPAGGQVQLEVVQGGPQPQLRVLQPPSGGDAPAQLLRNVLPQQQPLAQSLPPLLQLAGDPRIPEPVRRQLEQLRQMLPRRIGLVAPDTLRQVIRRSSLFAEAREENAPDSPQDLKHQLQQLAATLRKPPHPPSPASPTPSASGDTRQTPPPSPPPALRDAPQGQPTAAFPAVRTAAPTAATPTAATPTVTAQPTATQPIPQPAAQSGVSAAQAPSTPAPGTATYQSPDPLRHQQATPPSAPPPAPAPSPPTGGGPPPSEAVQDPALETLLDTLGRKVSAALARITVDQLASLPQPERPETVWHLEIPYQDSERLDVLTLVIKKEPERQTSSDEAPSALWSVDLELRPANLGTIRARLVLSGTQVSTYFWGEQAATRRLFQRHLGQLEQRLVRAGLTPAQLQVMERPLAAPNPKPPATGPLLNEEA